MNQVWRKLRNSKAYYVPCRIELIHSQPGESLQAHHEHRMNYCSDGVNGTRRRYSQRRRDLVEVGDGAEQASRAQHPQLLLLAQRRERDQSPLHPTINGMQFTHTAVVVASTSVFLASWEIYITVPASD
jgi:hypothetical protein